MEKQNNKVNAFQHKRQSQYTNFKTEIPFFETVVKIENSSPQKIIIVANLVWIKDENGNIRQTEQGTQYKVNIQDGQISFDKPLKFKNNG
jgi:hypothetical protein